METRTERLVLIHKYDSFVEYIYTPLNTAPKSQQVLRDVVLGCILEQYSLFHKAVKSGMVSRMYDADAGLATIRSYIKLLGSSDPSSRVLSLRQCETAETLLAECGKILGTMIKNKSRK